MIDEEGGFPLAVVGVEGDLEVGVVTVVSLVVLSIVAVDPFSQVDNVCQQLFVVD